MSSGRLRIPFQVKDNSVSLCKFKTSFGNMCKQHALARRMRRRLKSRNESRVFNGFRLMSKVFNIVSFDASGQCFRQLAATNNFSNRFSVQRKVGNSFRPHHRAESVFNLLMC